LGFEARKGFILKERIPYLIKIAKTRKKARIRKVPFTAWVIPKIHEL
jgi:hypothetical protein